MDRRNFLKAAIVTPFLPKVSGSLPADIPLTPELVCQVAVEYFPRRGTCKPFYWIDLHTELLTKNISTVNQLRNLLAQNIEKAFASDKRALWLNRDIKELHERGYFFTSVGMVRMATRS